MKLWIMAVLAGLAIGAWAAKQEPSAPAVPDIMIEGKTKKQVIDTLATYVSKPKIEVRVADDSIKTEKVLNTKRRGGLLIPVIGERIYRFTEAKDGIRIACSTRKFFRTGNVITEETDTTKGIGGQECLQTLMEFKKQLK